MINKVYIHGRLTRDPNTRETDTGIVARFCLAQNYFANGTQSANYIDCVAFGGLAHTIVEYCTKGTEVLIAGHVAKRSYDDADGNTVYTQSVYVDGIDFCGPKTAAKTTTDADDIMAIIVDDDLPFA